MATVNKNFKIKNGLVVEGTTATVNNFDILTKSTADQSYITALVGGSGESTNVADTLVLRDSNGDFAAGTITATFIGDLTGDVLGDVTGNVTGTVSSIANHDTDSLSEGVTNLYFTDARALSATAAAYDPAGSAATAESNANSYTDAREIAITTAYQTYADTAEADAIATAAADATAKDTALSTALQTYADTAEADAKSYTDSLIGDATVDGTGGNTVTARIATAVANLVDSAPATLDTLNELAAALQDNPAVITDLTTQIGTKVSKAGDTMTGALTLSGAPTSALHAATKQYVDDAESAANTYTDGEIATVNSTIAALDTDDIAEGAGNLYFTDERAQDAVGAMLTGTQTNITVSYDDVAGTLSFVAENGVADSTTDDLTEGSTNLYFTDARAQAAVAADITAAIDAVDTDDIEEGVTNLYFTDARAQSAVATDIATAVAAGDGTATPTYLAVDVNSVSLQVAATQNVATASSVVGYSWAIADYKSAELVVKVSDGTDSEVSKVLLTLDSSNNIAITEYGNVQTNASLSSVSATINGSDVELTVTTVNNNSDVTVAGTLMV